MFHSLIKKVDVWLCFGLYIPILSRKQLLRYAPVGSMVYLLVPTEDQSLPKLVFPIGSFRKLPPGYEFVMKEGFRHVAKIFTVTGYDYTPILSNNGLAPVVVDLSYNAGLMPHTWWFLKPRFDPKKSVRTMKLKNLAHRYLFVRDYWAENGWLKRK